MKAGKLNSPSPQNMDTLSFPPGAMRVGKGVGNSSESVVSGKLFASHASVCPDGNRTMACMCRNLPVSIRMCLPSAETARADESSSTLQVHQNK
jgi:hypothetical protein